MKIILTQNVPNLGSLGDEVRVKDGYARNFLLPRGMAMPAGGRDAAAVQHRRHFLERQRAAAIDEAQSEADKLRALELTVRMRAGTGGRLFGSVTNRDLQGLLVEQGFEVDRKSILLHTPVKTLGTFGATVKLHTDVKVDVEFRVEASEIVAPEPVEGEAEAAPAEAEAMGDEAATAEAEAMGDEAAPAEAGSGEAAGEATSSEAPAEEPTGA